MKKDWNIFWCSVFFVLGFSVIFSLMGVLLQTLLSDVSIEVQKWLGRIGGTLIILFGLYMLDLISFEFLQREHRFKVKHKFRSRYITSFVFGAAFAVGWTPCVGPVLGAVLALAATQPTSAFLLLLAYSMGLGIPFLLVGLFTNQARAAIKKYAKILKYVNYIFGVILIGIGTLIFTMQLQRFASVDWINNILLPLTSAGPAAQTLHIGVAFLAGVISFLSPCVLPIIPGFLGYLASITLRK